MLCKLFVMCVFFYMTECKGIKDIKKEGFSIVGNPIGRAHPCKENDDIVAVFESGLPPEEENKYQLNILDEFSAHTRIRMKFDSEATVTLLDDTVARISAYTENLEVFIHFFKPAKSLGMWVKGPSTGVVPYPTSIEVNNLEYCAEPNIGFLDGVIQGFKGTAHVSPTVHQSSCGRRKIVHTELIVNGQPTKPGDWPWHAAIYRLEKSSIKYTCGGTIIAKNFVLTAGHCVTINGVPVIPEILSVVFGKYNLIGGDIATQERQVLQVIVHVEYYHKKLDNDIALLKLTSEAIYDDYVQPACLWNPTSAKRLPHGIIYGTVVGWGLDHTNELSSELHQVVLPKIADKTCIKANPDFFAKVLKERKFCAGYRNGTSACNGDSGGGFVVFIPDVSGDSSENATGTWHVRGIVSLALRRKDAAICDPTQYSLFTDVSVFVGWIDEHTRTI